ncbi:MAG: hypothetical protein GF350_08805 [Chitinivibrionales bacterium]|nr:hypothetical protein [Chitinivibrionales bacterium]
MNKIACAGLPVIFYLAAGYALSGICVSDYNGPEINGINAHFIENDVTVDSIFLATSENRLGVRSGQINSYGTHCAFFKHEADGWYVCVTRINGATKMIKKITKVPLTGDAGDGRNWSILLE